MAAAGAQADSKKSAENAMMIRLFMAVIMNHMRAWFYYKIIRKNLTAWPRAGRLF